MAEELVLHIPDATDQSLQLLVTGEPFADQDPLGREADRWRIHFGEPDDLQWLALELDLGKRDGLVFDGEALQEPHAFPEQEPLLLRALQTSKFIGRHVAGCWDIPEEARPVAADQHGLTVRVRLGTVRLEFDPHNTILSPPRTSKPWPFAGDPTMTNCPTELTRKRAKPSSKFWKTAWRGVCREGGAEFMARLGDQTLTSNTSRAFATNPGPSSSLIPATPKRPGGACSFSSHAIPKWNAGMACDPRLEDPSEKNWASRRFFEPQPSDDG